MVIFIFSSRNKFASVTMNLGNDDFSLSEIFHLIIPRRSCSLIKDCQEGIVKSIIFNAGNPGMNVSSILEEIRKQSTLKALPRHIIEATVESLCKNGELRKEDEKYFLKEEEFKRMAEIIKERKKSLENVESEIYTRIEREGPSYIKSSKTAIRIFRDLVSNFLYAESRFITDMLACKEDVYEPASPLEILDTILSNVRDINTREVIRRSIVGTFESVRKEIIHIFYRAVLNLVCLEMLSIDPSGSMWRKGDFSGKTVILDTNVLLALVLRDHPQHEVTNDVISITSRLGVNFVFTERTKREWLEVLEKANQRFRFLNSTRPSLLGKVEDIFIRSYFKKREDDPSLRWHEYYSQMKRIESLVNVWGIQPYEEKEEYTSDAEGLRVLEDLSDEVYRSGRRRLDARFIKSKSVSEHDAYHLLLVRRLREKSPSDSFGPSCWFLTYDVSLIEADRALNMLLKSPHAAPSILLMDTWFLISSLFLKADIEEKKLARVFVELFRSYFVTPPGGLSASMIVEVLNPYLSYKSLSDDDLKAVLENEDVKRLYFELRDARSSDPEKARLIYDALRQQVDRIVWGLLENKAKEAGIP